MKIKNLVINAMVAALYAVITLIFPSFTAFQFRLSEIFAHLPVFDKRYAPGLVLGVVVANLASPFALFDVTFGTLHTVVSLILMLVLTKGIKNIYLKLTLNTVIFSATSFIIALMILYFEPSGTAFWPIYFSVAISIAVVMGIGIPIMVLLDRTIGFSKQLDK
ncbi:MAG TPA: QueT transporter family protein [Alloiococcus sp.]|nr:QueT transporter family protein [Alloiococcus sp.]